MCILNCKDPLRCVMCQAHNRAVEQRIEANRAIYSEAKVLPEEERELEFAEESAMTLASIIKSKEAGR